MRKHFGCFVLAAYQGMFYQMHRRPQTAIPEKRGLFALSWNFFFIRLFAASAERSVGSISAQHLNETSLKTLMNERYQARNLLMECHLEWRLKIFDAASKSSSVIAGKNQAT